VGAGWLPQFYGWFENRRLADGHQLFEVVTTALHNPLLSKNKPIKTISYRDYELVTAHFSADCRLTEHSFSMASSRITSDQTQ
jgi:hypothetical protein